MQLVDIDERVSSNWAMAVAIISSRTGDAINNAGAAAIVIDVLCLSPIGFHRPLWPNDSDWPEYQSAREGSLGVLDMTNNSPSPLPARIACWGLRLMTRSWVKYHSRLVCSGGRSSRSVFACFCRRDIGFTPADQAAEGYGALVWFRILMV